MFSERILLLTYFAAVFMLNLFVYMIAEYYRRVVDKKLNSFGFVVSMCAMSAAIGAIFVSDDYIFVRLMTTTMLVAGISSLLSGIELYFFTRKSGE